MLKRADAPYLPGRRGKWWLKLKRELTTLDVVVVGVEWGHGKRNKVLSDYTFAVRAAADSDELLTIGKAYSGLTDAEILQMTAWFLEHQRGALGAHALAVEPSVVIEVAFTPAASRCASRASFACGPTSVPTRSTPWKACDAFTPRCSDARASCNDRRDAHAGGR